MWVRDRLCYKCHRIFQNCSNRRYGKRCRCQPVRGRGSQGRVNRLREPPQNNEPVIYSDRGKQRLLQYPDDEY